MIGAATLLGTGLGSAQTTTSTQDSGSSDGLFLAAMTGEQEQPSVETAAGGGAVFAYDEARDSIEYAVMVDSIENVTMAHIHQGAPGESGPVVQWLYPGPEPTNEGQLIQGQFDGVLQHGTFSANDLVGPLEGASLDDLLGRFREGGAYVNVHTEQHPPGEVRGVINPLSTVIEALGGGQ